MSIWRNPDEESDDIYPGLVVCDNRVTGSITIGPTRLPVWAIVPSLISDEQWEHIRYEYEPQCSQRDMAQFLSCLLEMRGEFGRLLLELAEAERAERSCYGAPWWTTKIRRRRVKAQLQRCLDALSE